MIVLDTNILIYAHRSGTSEHQAARQAVEQAYAQGACGIALPSIAEFWSIVTHPKSVGGPSKPQEAQSFIDALVNELGFHICLPGLDFSQRLMQLAGDLGITGIRIFDLQIALIALENSATHIWTHDRNFVGVPGLKIHDPI